MERRTGEPSATSIQAIAREAGVVATSIYRRWPSKVPLIEDAIFALDTGYTPPITGELRADLLAWTRLFLQRAADPAARTAIPGLLSAYHDDQSSYQRLLNQGEQPTRATLRQVVNEAVAKGQAAPDCDVDVLFELMRGATLIRALTRGAENADEFSEQIADALVAVARTPAGR
ncbi:TetR/AcrR family transcriptional regulator [Saccharopolyspora shandongensis]|uniref:TetR/AcrR family transcriptional regulator n=1 Tax=Saccharopolyspora shandongensis TaxID=418495 RepID=UPI0033E76400